jgi:dTDP-4-dehydrorhamnose reductase
MKKAMAEVWVLFGATGWLGGELLRLLRAQNQSVTCVTDRLENRERVAHALDVLKPTHVLNVAGVTGRPNVDWCETHREETIRANVIGTLNLADLCSQRGIHMTNYSTGCIYEYDEAHPEGSGIGFLEQDPPNFHGSFYAHSKALAEDLIENYRGVLTLRIRMPLTDSPHPRNFITKITSYPRVVNVPNSMTVLDDLLPVSLVMAQRRISGVYNFTNPGVISHNEILDLYTRYVDPTFTYCNFSVEEQSKVLKSGRSNNELDVGKLLAVVPDLHIPHIQQSIVALFKRWSAGRQMSL